MRQQEKSRCTYMWSFLLWVLVGFLLSFCTFGFHVFSPHVVYSKRISTPDKELPSVLAITCCPSIYHIATHNPPKDNNGNLEVSTPFLLPRVGTKPDKFLPLAVASHSHAAGRRRDGVRTRRPIRDGRGRRDAGPDGVRGRPAAVARDGAHGECCRAG